MTTQALAFFSTFFPRSQTLSTFSNISFQVDPLAESTMTRRSKRRFDLAIDDGRDPGVAGRPPLLTKAEDKVLEKKLVDDAKGGIHYDYQGIASQVSPGFPFIFFDIFLSLQGNPRLEETEEENR
jgi:hypothetical protein